MVNIKHMLEKSEWIWIDNKNDKNTYAQFIEYFNIEESINKVTLNIACDSKYSLWINGALAGFGGYADYPFYKVADSLDITKFVATGKNMLAICVWYKGEESQCYTKGNAGVIFEVVSKTVVATSNKKVLSRYSKSYDSLLRTNITGQLGYTFAYDSRKEDCWNQVDYDVCEFKNSVVITTISKQFNARPIKNLVLEDRCSAKTVQQGEFIYGQEKELSIAMQNAFLGYRELSAMVGTDKCASNSVQTYYSSDDNGIYLIVDLLAEQAGFLDLDIDVEKETQIDIGFGEHLADGRVRTAVGGRNFVMSYFAKEGRQSYINTFLRIGCRYLQLFIHAKQIKVHYLGLRPTSYPVVLNMFNQQDFLRKNIYWAAVRTLRLCMHEHYEDTPWREQGLYTMDSRNQMLFGAYAFEGYEFQRASLVLISKGLRADGLLNLTFPSILDLTIPYFSFVYPLQVKDYIDYSGDLTLVGQVFKVIKTILDTAVLRIDGNGLINEYDGPCWNFYEWIERFNGYGTAKKDYSLILNAMLSLALISFAEICNKIGEAEQAKKYCDLNQILNNAINANFYDEENQMYFSYINKFDEKMFSQLGNSLAILCGASNKKAKDLAKKLLLGDMIPSTLSMTFYKYEALRLVDCKEYEPIILDEIDETFGKMLFKDSTTFWETVEGEKDFDRAGSLCHGWSAMPVYYYQLAARNNKQGAKK